jgi:hypothetical protein
VVEGVEVVALRRLPPAAVALFRGTEKVVRAQPGGADERGQLVGEGRLAGGVDAIHRDASGKGKAGDPLDEAGYG